jgi:uncharacterized protein
MKKCESQAETIAFLSKAETYNLPGPVERIDTHAAIIFLAGDRAYKLKRAVRYPYFDFSTLARRKAVCEAELALNRRTAPKMYISVEQVGRNEDGGLALGCGEPVDWVLVMRRFNADDLIDAMAKEHRLDLKLIRDLAEQIASFHLKADAVIGPGAARIRKVIDGNRESMAALAPGLLPARECEVLHERSLAMLEILAPLLDRRAATGFVRRCHGDLHLANICLWEGRPTLFDCLEFDPELATTDVLYDLAFLLMDLWHRQLRQEASLLFNWYCDMCSESEGLAAIGLFLSMRAAVRAHVSASAAEQQKEKAERNKRVRDARDYLSAAIIFLDRPAPCLIAIGGLSGSGKSTLAGKLSPHIGAAPGARWLRSDVLRKRLAGVTPECRLPAEAYTEQRGKEVYRKLLEEARLALKAGMPAIVDAVFAATDEREAITALAAENNVPFTGIWLEAPRELLHKRVNERLGDISDADAAVVDRQLSYALGDLDWHRISATESPDSVLANTIELIG